MDIQSITVTKSAAPDTYKCRIKEQKEIKIRFNEPKYFIDEKKRIVTCKLIWHVDFPSGINPWSTKVGKFFYKNQTSIGVAKCMEDDKFDIEIGKRLARTKAETTAYKIARVQLRFLYEDFYAQSSKVGKFIMKAEKVINHNNIYMDKNF